MNGNTPVHHHPEGIVYTDADLLREVRARLTQVSEFDCAHVSVQVQSCKVTLTGSVHDSKARYVIEELVEACPGVQDVDNRIQVKPTK